MVKGVLSCHGTCDLSGVIAFVVAMETEFDSSYGKQDLTFVNVT